MANQKKRVYFNEYNILMANSAYLPLNSGLLQAYAETNELITENYQFMPYLFYRDSLENILPNYENPSVAAFSVSMWNEQLNLEVAQEVKKLYPKCLVIFGGPQVPQHPQEYFKNYPFIDVTVRSEGEEAFTDILIRFLESRDFSGLPGVSFWDEKTNSCIRNDQERAQSKDLDIYPSPYLEGKYDELMEKHNNLDFQVIIETNRGCPFPCSFCFWGQGGLSRKYRFHGLERVAREIEWCAIHSIKYVFNADSNFGMHKRDMDIAQMLVDIKAKYGYPEKFRTCFGKNTDDKIYNIAMLLHQHDLEKGITLARQSDDSETLINIRRQNIKLSTYNNLQTRFNEGNVPVYTELIIGLPGETYESWTKGIENMLQAGLKNQIFVYQCQIFPNTEMADPEYQKRFGIVTNRVVLNEIHGAEREGYLVPEYEDIIITTNSMPLEEWRRISVLSWLTMMLHSLKLGFFIMYYLNKRYDIRYTDFIAYISELHMPEGMAPILTEEINRLYLQLDHMLEGKGRGHVVKEFGNIYWDEEEIRYLRISNDLEQFYDEILTIVCAFLKEKGIDFNENEVAEAIEYQRLRIPLSNGVHQKEYQFSFNFPEYFGTCFKLDPAELLAMPQTLTLENQTDYNGDKVNYARKTILWGRKSGTMLVDVKWEHAPSPSTSKQDGMHTTMV